MHLASILLTIGVCMYFIHQYGAMPAGRLAELTGLTTAAAVKRIIDRLEKAEFVRRTNDPKDRSQTIVEPTQNKKWEKRKIEAIFILFHERMHKLPCLYTLTMSWLFYLMY